MSKIINMVGERYERLLVTSRADNNKSGRAMWNCLCDCGKTKAIIGVTLRNGRSKSCGCIRSEMNTERLTIHGMAQSPEYSVWVAMIQRCTNPNNKEFENYGDRGISVCERWVNSFSNFIKDMGERPTHRHSIERVDNNTGYSPENCAWATMTEQSKNKRTTIFCTINGVKKPLVDWAREYCIDPGLIRDRKRRGWSDEQAVFNPLIKH